MYNVQNKSIYTGDDDTSDLIWLWMRNIIFQWIAFCVYMHSHDISDDMRLDSLTRLFFIHFLPLLYLVFTHFNCCRCSLSYKFTCCFLFILFFFSPFVCAFFHCAFLLKPNRYSQSFTINVIILYIAHTHTLLWLLLKPLICTSFQDVFFRCLIFFCSFSYWRVRVQ